MLHVPGKFTFVHIPRTGGNSITRTLATHLIGSNDLLCVTCRTRLLWRHMPAREIVSTMPQVSQCPIFAIDREPLDLIQSDYELWKVTPKRISHEVEFVKKCEAAHKSYAAFLEYWKRFLNGQTINEYWTGGVEVTMLPFDNMDQTWQTLCDAAGLKDVQLDKYDYQKHWYIQWTKDNPR